MAIKDHLRQLKEGVESWNAWQRQANESADLSGADLRGMQLSGVQFNDANLTEVNLGNSYLVGAEFVNVDLDHAQLAGVNFSASTIFYSSLENANLLNSSLELVMFHDINLRRANFSGATLFKTVFANVDLTGVSNLDKCLHDGPSAIDFRTLQKSGPLPQEFLRGVGLPDMLIDYLPSLLNQAIQHYSCFISYSSKDQDFADRLHADLQNGGVRCWFAPHDMPIGGKILDEIDTGIKLRDKVLLILSRHSIKSDWVEDEVTKAFEEERKRGQTVLFPIRLDNAVMATDEAWAAKLRNQRHIGDFQRWKSHDSYKKSFQRVLRDLRVKNADSQR
jgi:uncharacterized protein YjbI with pentapeptide repeats